MTIRNITPENLPILSSITNDKGLISYTDICYEHSKLSINDEGNITSAILLRLNSVANFFNGAIPIIDDDKAGIKDISENVIPIEQQYEIACLYLKEEYSYEILESTYYSLYYNKMHPLGIVWMDFQKAPENPIGNFVFYNFGFYIWIDVPDVD